MMNGSSFSNGNDARIGAGESARQAACRSARLRSQVAAGRNARADTGHGEAGLD
jgi:hypothetical protein